MSSSAAPRRPARRTRLTAAAIATPLALGVVLTGCSAGQQAQTAAKRPGVEGSSAKSGDLSVLNAHLVSPGDDHKYEAGDTVEMELVVASSGAGDEITAITVDGEEATISASGGATTAGTGSSTSIEIPAGGLVVIGENGDYTVETTMTSEVYPATLLPVVITFQDAGDVELNVPVAASLDEVPRDPDQVYTPEEGEGGGH